MDLFRQSGSSGSTDEQSKARSRQQFISLLQRFKFVRQCIQCSARNLLNLDEVFLKAQEAVLCPINPLYDLSTGRLAPDCRRALTRIFRIYDKDNDFLLSNSELIAFQNETFHVPLMERDLAGWKKVVSRNNPTQEAVVREGKFTVSGFISIFDVFIDQNRLDVPWRMFRNFGYDDDLNLDIPASVTFPDGLVGDDNSIQNWKLSVSAQKFLTAMFHQFDDNKDGVLSGSDIMSVFSVIPEPSLPPWHSLRSPDVFAGCYSLPKMHTALSVSADSLPSKPETSTSSTTNAPFSPTESGITVISGQTSSSDASSSAVMRSFSKPLSFLEWMAHWHMISAISPSATRAELYRLGHVEERIRKKANARKHLKRKSVSPSEVDFSSVLLASREVRVVVFGRRGCGKTALLNALCSLNEDETVFESDPLRTERNVTPETSCTYVRLKKHLKGKNEGEGEDLIVNFIVTEVPEEDPLQAQNKTELSAMLGRGNGKQQKFDLVVFAFDCTDPSSVSYVKDVESELLTDEVPRVFVGTKKDMPDGNAGNWSSEHDIEAPSSINYSSAATQVKHHCAELDLEPPLLTSASKTMLGGDDEEGARQRRFTLEHLARCTFDGEEEFQLRSKPHAARKRREAARRNKMMWLGGIAVSVSVVVAVGVGVIWGGKNSERRHDRLVWLRNWFTGGSSSKAEETRA
jgi:Ras family protein T1